MAKPKKKALTCRHCTKAGVPKEENSFKTKAQLRMHLRGKHKMTGGPDFGKPKAALEKEVVVQEPINFCCFCGKQLPNAMIIR